MLKHMNPDTTTNSQLVFDVPSRCILLIATVHDNCAKVMEDSQSVISIKQPVLLAIKANPQWRNTFTTITLIAIRLCDRWR